MLLSLCLLCVCLVTGDMHAAQQMAAHLRRAARSACALALVAGMVNTGPARADSDLVGKTVVDGEVNRIFRKALQVESDGRTQPCLLHSRCAHAAVQGTQ